ncbi:MAG: UDP-N-acetylmuramoyl-tripeptide--D-alanyl-D-alanine ligase [Actinomycetes bacterium]
MIPLDLATLSRAVDGTLRVGDPTTVVDAVETDSRRAGPGALFVALRGEHADGHAFAADAAAGGASAVLVEREVDAGGAAVVEVPDTWDAIGVLAAHVRDTVDPLVVGITGSVGKTTTKDLTAAALSAGRRTVAAPGSFNNELGVPLTLLATRPDTEALVVEIGARGRGHIASLTPWVRPDVAIVTAVAGVHLELFGTVEDVAVAKAELVEALDADGTAVLNGADHRVRAMAERTDARVLLYGPEGTGDLDVVVTDVELDRLARPRGTVRTPWGDVEVALPIAGAHNLHNAAAALAVAGATGVDLAAAADALADVAVSRWRGEVVDAGGVVVLNDAYNANPTAVAAALDTLVAIERSGRAVAVLGVMAEIGADHDLEHARTGRRAVAAGVDLLVVVGERAAAMASGAREDAPDPDRVVEVPDAEAALALLRDELVAGDVVLVKASRVGGLETVAAGLVEARGDGA